LCARLVAPALNKGGKNLIEPGRKENPASRLSQTEMDDLKFTFPTSLAEDTKEAMKDNFPIEQLPDWNLISEKIEQGWIFVHELRTVSTGELLSSRLIVDYPSRLRGEAQFLLVSLVVTPDATGQPNSKRSKSKGYGSLLRQKSLEICRLQKPHALGFVAERESPKGATSSDDQRVKRASWMARIGLHAVSDYAYEIPPLVSQVSESEPYVPVADRPFHIKPADLLIFRFDGKRSISGKTLRSIVERLLLGGYSIDAQDPYFQERIMIIDESRDYALADA
jgi:hypothetical protein